MVLLHVYSSRSQRGKENINCRSASYVCLDLGSALKERDASNNEDFRQTQSFPTEREMPLADSEILLC